MPLTFDTETFGFLMTDVARLMRQEFDRQINQAGLGLTPGEARALCHAARAGPVRQNVLADQMGIEAMTLCAYLDRLQAQGLVRRTTDPSDRRAKLVHLTAEAQDVLTRIAETAKRARAPAEGAMTSEEWQMLLALLRRVRVGLSGSRREESADAA